MSLTVDAAKYGMKVGSPAVRSVASLAFGPGNIVFLADNLGAAIYAIDLGPSVPTVGGAPSVNLDHLDMRMASYLGCQRRDVFVKDMAVRPGSYEVYFSVMRGRGAAASPLLMKLTSKGEFTEVPLENVAFSKARIEDAPAEDDTRTEVRLIQGKREGEEVVTRSGAKLQMSRDPLRTVTVTDMAYVDGLLLVAGASNEEFSSTLRRIPFPFTGGMQRNSLEIFHVSHAKYETASPIRTFVPYGGNRSILASYTCTPIVHFAFGEVATGTQVKGKTVAELGAGNTPLDMISYRLGGSEYLLVSNARHPLMKIACSDIDRQEALTQPKEPLGVPRVNLPQQGVSRMATLPDGDVLMLQQDEAGNLSLHSYNSAAL